VADHHAQILFDGRDFNLEEADRQAEITINGKKKRRARLAHGDRIALGSAELSFSIFADTVAFADDEERSQPGRPPRGAAASELAGLQKLQAFSEKLMHKGSLDELLDTMLGDVLALTGAEKGVILLTAPGEVGEDKTVSVRAARNVRKEAITDER